MKYFKKVHVHPGRRRHAPQGLTIERGNLDDGTVFDLGGRRSRSSPYRAFARVSGVPRQRGPIRHDRRRHRLEHGLMQNLQPPADHLPSVGEEARSPEGASTRVYVGHPEQEVKTLNASVPSRHADGHRAGARRQHRDDPVRNGQQNDGAGGLNGSARLVFNPDRLK